MNNVFRKLKKIFILAALITIPVQSGWFGNITLWAGKHPGKTFLVGYAVVGCAAFVGWIVGRRSVRAVNERIATETTENVAAIQAQYEKKCKESDELIRETTLRGMALRRYKKERAVYAKMLLKAFDELETITQEKEKLKSELSDSRASLALRDKSFENQLESQKRELQFKIDSSEYCIQQYKRTINSLYMQYLAKEKEYLQLAVAQKNADVRFLQEESDSDSTSWHSFDSESDRPTSCSIS